MTSSPLPGQLLKRPLRQVNHGAVRRLLLYRDHHFTVAFSAAFRHQLGPSLLGGVFGGGVWRRVQICLSLRLVTHDLSLSE